MVDDVGFGLFNCCLLCFIMFELSVNFGVFICLSFIRVLTVTSEANSSVEEKEELRVISFKMILVGA